MTRSLPFTALPLLLLASHAAFANSGPETLVPATTGTIIAPDSPVRFGTRYGRMVRPRHGGKTNGALIATFESWPDDFGIYRSDDDGATWNRIATTHETQFPGWQFKAEPDLFALPSAAGDLPAGTLLLAGNSERGQGHQLEIYCSRDAGVTWRYRGMVDTNGGTGAGLWEPRLNVTSAGQLICYYSDERQAGYNQLLGERVSPDGGLTWGTEQYACAIPGGKQRPGMAVTTRLPNGQYVMSFECIGDGASGPVHIKFSGDGITWGSGPGDYGIPVQSSAGAYPAGTPYIVWSPAGGPNGTLIVSARSLEGTTSADREIFVNHDLGRGAWSTIPSPVQWQGGAALAGWSTGMIPTADGQGIIQLASSGVNGNNCRMLVGTEKLPGDTPAPRAIPNPAESVPKQ